VGSLVARADLLRKISFPRYVVVVSVGASAMISFGLSMLVIALFMILARVSVRPSILCWCRCSSSWRRSPWPWLSF